MINQRCVRWGGIDFTHCKQTSKQAYERLDTRQHLRSGDVIWNSTGTGTIGRAAIFPEIKGQYVPDSHVTVLRPIGTFPQWIEAWISTHFVQQRVAGIGSTNQVELSRDTVLNMPTPYVPPPEQKKILQRLEYYFAEIGEGERALAEARGGLNTYRASLLNAAVTGELTAEWRREHPSTETGTDLRRRILAKRDGKLRITTRRTAGARDTTADETGELPELPASWCWARVGQIVDQTDYGTSVKCDRNTSGIPVIRMGNIQDGRLDLDDLKYAPRGSKDIPILERGDILFNRTNSAELLGKTAVYDGELAPCSFASYIVRLRLEKIEPRFFAAWLNSSYGKAWIAQNKSQQVGQANLSAGKLMQMSVPVAPLAEQKAVVEKLGEALIAANGLRADDHTLATQCSALRQSVLSAAFRGELV